MYIKITTNSLNASCTLEVQRRADTINILLRYLSVVFYHLKLNGNKNIIQFIILLS